MPHFWIVKIFTIIVAEVIAYFSEPALDAYIKYCGIEKTCNLDKNLQKYANQSVGIQRQCQMCICDKEQCTFDFYCCPDIILPRVSTEGFDDWSFNNFSIPVIDVCPENANITLIEMCSKNWRDITDEEFFVVYNSLPRSIKFYKNRYCALCNDIKTWTPLNFMLFCEESGFPLNVYSSIEALSSGASKYGCQIQFEDIAHVRLGYINSCNVTGQWENYNKDTEWACRYYGKLPYSIFKNIFCYMCNTGSSPRQPYIDSCLSHIDVELEKMCLSEIIDTRFYPFKNQYCKNCNKLSAPGTDDFNVYTLRTPYIKEYTHFEWHAIAYPQLCYIRHLDSYKFLKISSVMDSLCHESMLSGEQRISLQKEFDDRYQNSITNRSSRFMNITSLYTTYRQIFGSKPWCSQPTENITIPCSCDMSCFDDGNCCPDIVIFSKESECIDFESYSPSIYSKCNLPMSDRVMQYYCERKEEEYESLIDWVPFYDRTNHHEYKNLFCKICSEPEEKLSYNGYFWGIDVKCREFVDIENYLRNGKAFMELRDMCDVKFDPEFWRGTMLQPADHKCPQNVNKDISPSDLLYLCTWAGNFIYSTCKSKYKNVFCQMYHMYKCSNDTCEFTSQSMQSFHCNATDDERRGSYPMTFTFNPKVSRRNMINNVSSNCESDEFYDEKNFKCRVIKCVQGKFFFNGKCVPLLRNTTRLGYHAEMIATAVTSVTEGTYSIKDIVLDLLHNIKSTLHDIVVQSLFVNNITVMAPAPCNSSWKQITDTEKLQGLLIDIKFITHLKVVSRQQVDELILETMSKTFNIPVYGIEFQVRKSNSDSYGNWLRRNQILNCFTTLSFSIDSRYHFEVHKFLVCSQIALEAGEYQLVNSNLLVVPRLKHQIEIPYTLGSDNEVLVCLNDYLTSFSVSSTLAHVSVTMFFLNFMFTLPVV